MTRLDGIDVAHYQYDHAPIDWPTVAAAGCWWGATKLTQSTSYIDPTAAQSRAGMHAAGFTHIGLYHWLSSTSDPRAQAAWFLSCLGVLERGEFVMLDAEEAGITAGEVIAWCEAVEARTKRPVAVYTGAYVAGGTIWQSTSVREGTYGARPMVLAAYTSEATARALPGVKAYPWSAWQYSSNGPVPGVTGRCDMDQVDDRAVFDQAAGRGDAPPPQPAPQPAPQLSEVDMHAFTHSDNDHDGHPPRWTFWTLMDDGTKRHLSGVELDGILKQRDTAPAIPMADIDTLPDYTPPAGGVDFPAPMHFTGTIDLRAATS